MLKRAMDRILVVGAGITGAVTASILRRELPNKCYLAVWDKASGSGGRMTTSRSPKNPQCSVDLGAQYISADPVDYQNHYSIYKELEENSLLKPLTGIIEGDKERPEGTQHFVSPDGTGTLVKYFLKKSDSDIHYGQQVARIDEENKQWLVTTNTGRSEAFDAVVLTMPVPQILALQGSIVERLGSHAGSMEAVQYSSRFVLGLFFEPETHIDVSWCAKYFRGDPVIVFVSIDSKRRNTDNSEGTSVLVHASVPFSLSHLDEDKETVCRDHLLPRVRELIPNLPTPTDVKCHKWRYSQVFQGYKGSPGSVTLCERPLLVCAGDAFTHSNFDGCVDSATSAAHRVMKVATQTSL